MKLLSLQDLESRAEASREWIRGRKAVISVCMGSGCISAGSEALLDLFRRAIADEGLSEQVPVMGSGCLGFCGKGPVILVRPEGVLYCGVDEAGVSRIVKEHIVGGKPVAKYLYGGGAKDAGIALMDEIPFYKGQKLLVLAGRGCMDPESIDSYMAADGYSALGKALSAMSPDLIIDAIKESGLRGRGGRGFHAWMKWESCRMAAGPEKFVVCNCDDGAPGAYAGRTVLENSPHAVIEAMAIGARAVGASMGFIYVRTEYDLAVGRVEKALAQAREYGLLGRGILGTGFDFDIRAVHGESAFICGESTALIASIEGRPAEPRHDQVHSSEKGLWGRPTLLSNVETWANVPPIIRNGAAWFRSVGSPSCPGTKVLTPGGRIRNLGVVEVPTGTPLSEIVFGPCGGPGPGRRIKAVQACGPAGGLIPERMLGTGLAYESLEEAGAMMCTGGLIVFDDRTCIVETVRSSIEFMSEECCGKCSPCREGLPRMLALLESICRGRARAGDLEFLEEIAWTLKDASFCGLGKSAANPVLSSLKCFRDEYVAHADEKRCPAGVCPELTRFVIDPEKCSGCGLCRKACPAGAVAGAPKEAHSIKEEICVKCGACRDACRKEAVFASGTAAFPVQRQLLR